MLKTLLGAARWLYELERGEGYRPGNWQIHGSYMLAQIAMVLPEFRESEEWLRMALQRLQEHLKLDFFEDGGTFRTSPAQLHTCHVSELSQYELSVEGVQRWRGRREANTAEDGKYDRLVDFDDRPDRRDPGNQ
jgi:hypothetical protein